uniref:Uncharacterized protein n=1 Tax=Photinus pyralis TaxID=7054 RepID=A0A1Y1LBJ3_PHOPY
MEDLVRLLNLSVSVKNLEKLNEKYNLNIEELSMCYSAINQLSVSFLENFVFKSQSFWCSIDTMLERAVVPVPNDTLYNLLKKCCGDLLNGLIYQSISKRNCRGKRSN